MTNSKLKIAIFDLTDCEGCELQFIALREKLLARGNDFEILNWRLANSTNSPGPFDVTFIEGSPITETDIEILKQARKVSKYIITLGSCAEFGGVQSALSMSKREKNVEEVYGRGYKTSSKPPRPVSYYVDVDIHLPGCPVSIDELERLLTNLFANKKFSNKKYPVCLECKAEGNPCLLLDEGFCLGPVTRGGCGALCPKYGLRCYGCFGPIEDANLPALKAIAIKHVTEREIEKNFRLFFAHTDAYKDYKTNPKTRVRRKRRKK
jgi:sulfhydrogenase subunit delta